MLLLPLKPAVPKQQPRQKQPSSLAMTVQWIHVVVLLLTLGFSVKATLVLEIDFADPCVLRDTTSLKQTYHAFATNRVGPYGQNVQHAVTYPDTLRAWTVFPDALPRLGKWAKEGKTWAPYVFRAQDDQYTMWYTATHAQTGWQCIGSAKVASTYELSVFKDYSDTPLVCPQASRGAIDPYMYEEDGQQYLLYSASVNGSGIWIQAVNDAGNQTTEAEAHLLIQVDRDWERGVNEAPTLIKRKGKYILFYSAASYIDDKYVTSYAVADHLKGPYVKSGKPLLSTSLFQGSVRGPGGQDVFSDRFGKQYIAYHGWDKDFKERQLHINHLEWSQDKLPILGKDV